MLNTINKNSEKIVMKPNYHGFTKSERKNLRSKLHKENPNVDLSFKYDVSINYF